MSERYTQPFPILESYPFEPVQIPHEPLHDMDISNAINARMIARQSQIDSLMQMQEQDRIALSEVRETMRRNEPRRERRARVVFDTQDIGDE